MKTKFLILVIAFAYMVKGWGQEGYYNIGFEKDTIRVEKSDKKDVIIPLKLKTLIFKKQEWKDYFVRIQIDEENTTLIKSDYEMMKFERNFSQLENETIFFVLKKDSIEDRTRKITLSINSIKKDTLKEENVNEKNSADNKKIVIVVESSSKESESLSDYNILSYIGTNFDMAEGKTRAQNLFFATNIFMHPQKERNKLGFYLSLYGNRTMSDIDSTGNVRNTYKIEKLTDSTYVEYTSQNKMITTKVSDNIGAYISPLIKIFNSQKNNNDVNLYYSPSLEFVWRRISVTREFKNPTNLDSIIITGTIPGSLELDKIHKREYNEYAFNAGVLGLFLSYENKDISVRVHGSVGYSSSFYPKFSSSSEVIAETDRVHDIFFSGRAWITEPKTGITLQAEIINTSKYPRPYFGVTLSKAFRLKELSGFFSPITDR
ncbi:MAG: hypothetical protein WCY89_00730 [Flavobacteriaceae bacterium]